MKLGRSICFVDEDEDEIRRFRSIMRDRYIIGAGYTVPDALSDLRQQGVKRPDIFLIDLYYGPETDDTKRAEVAEAHERISEKAKELGVLLVKAGQTPHGGFELAEQVRRKHSQIPLAFFSRKATMEDAERAYHNSIAVIRKPDPDDNDTGTRAERYDAALKRHRDELVRRIDGIIGKNTWWVRHRRWVELVIAFVLGVGSNAAWSMAQQLFHWIFGGVSSP
jgi:thioesterase domain-containing protein